MPEYLAPGVYVEEIPSGNKPIQAASTSTAGMVGMAARGPVDQPTLVTSRGAYARLFGGELDPLVFTDQRDALPYAAAGFFDNLGARLYVVRVVGSHATHSTLRLVARDTRVDAAPVLARTAREGDRALLLGDPGALAEGTPLLLAGPTGSETATVSGVLPVLGGGLASAFPTGSTVTVQNATELGGTLADPVAAGTTELAVSAVTGATANDILLLADPGGTAATAELVTVQDVDPATGALTLETPTRHPHDQDATLSTLADGATTATTETDAGPSTAAVLLDLDDPSGVQVGRVVRLADPAATTEELALVTDVITTGDELPVLGGGLASAFPTGSTVTLQNATELPNTLADPVAAGTTQLVLSDLADFPALPAENEDPLTLLLADDLDGTAAELVTVTEVNTATNALTLEAPTRHPHDQGARLSRLADALDDDTDTPITTTTETDAGPSTAPVFLDLEDPSGVQVGSVVRLANPEETTEELALVTDVPQLVTLAAPLRTDHAPGATVTAVVDVLTVHARWPGRWGDSLRITASPASLAVTTTSVVAPAGATTLTLANAIGLYPGSVLVLPDEATAEVATVDTRTGVVGLTAALATEVAAGAAVRSREHTLLVERREGDRSPESESFELLSLTPGHPRFAPVIVGAWDAAAGRPSDVGASELVRLEALADATTRRMPLVDAVPRHLTGGDDDVTGVTEQTYVGRDADDPEKRGGIQAFRDEPTISMVAAPGQTSLTVQQALVDHCEKMRYRFAVLDVPLGSTVAQARTHRQNFDTTRAALYYPGVQVADRFGPAGAQRTVAASGHVLGVYARTDLTRGVHKAPGNEVVRGVLALRTALTKGEQDILNPINLNCLRDFRAENRGIRVYGARVATSDPEWRYVNVRRLLLFIEQSLDTGLQYAVFEPNDKPLWDTVKQSITGFLVTVWRSGALEGSTEEEAFFVNIGYDVTMTQADIDNGLLVVEVGVAPVKPAEFVVVRISQKTRDAVA